MLLRPIGRKAVKLLREHIAAGCLSDPDGVALYYAIGKTREGLSDYRCVRGTNATEVRRVGERLQLFGLFSFPGCFVAGP